MALQQHSDIRTIAHLPVGIACGERNSALKAEAGITMLSPWGVGIRFWVKGGEPKLVIRMSAGDALAFAREIEHAAEASLDNTCR